MKKSLAKSATRSSRARAPKRKKSMMKKSKSVRAAPRSRVRTASRASSNGSREDWDFGSKKSSAEYRFIPRSRRKPAESRRTSHSA